MVKILQFLWVGALDKDPIKTGAEYAKKHGWDTPEKAISGGADFIHKHFLSSTDQNTLYSMRWNPKIQENINMLLILSGQKVMQQLSLTFIRI